MVDYKIFRLLSLDILSHMLYTGIFSQFCWSVGIHTGMNKVYNAPHVVRQLQFPFFPLGIHLKFVRVLICQLLHAIVILPASWFLS